MSIFESLMKYANKYQVKESRAFSAEEIDEVVSARVVASNYGLSACFFMKEGCQKYIPMSVNAVCQVGDSIDLTKARILILQKEGSEDIVRIDI